MQRQESKLSKQEKINQLYLEETTIHEELEAEWRAMQREEEILKHSLSVKEKQDRDVLIKDIQNIIWALKFENGPQLSDSGIPAFWFLDLLTYSRQPWQKIVVSEGPQSDAMYEVLKAAKLALEKLDINILNTAKEKYQGQFDRVKTVFKGEKSFSQNNYYANFAKFFSTVSNQPGDHVHEILERVETMLEKHCQQKVDNTSKLRK